MGDDFFEIAIEFEPDPMQSGRPAFDPVHPRSPSEVKMIRTVTTAETKVPFRFANVELR